MTLVQLKHLISLSEHGSFTTAAEASHLTQSAFSRSIQALEDALGQALVDRIGKRFEVTPFGREMVVRAKQLVFEAEEMMNRGREMATGRGGVLRIGLGAASGALLTQPLIRTMATRHTGTRLTIARGDAQLLTQKLRDRDLDAIVTDVRMLPAAADLVVRDVIDLPGAFMCRPGHPLTRWKGKLTFATVRQFPLASSPWSEETRRLLIQRYGAQAHPDECLSLSCEEVSAMTSVVASSDAVLLAVRAVAPSLVELPVRPALDLVSSIGIVTLSRRTEAAALSVVKELLSTLARGG